MGGAETCTSLVQSRPDLCKGTEVEGETRAFSFSH